MNKTAIKNFAIWARNKLRADIILKAGLLGITDKEISNPLPQSTDDLQIFDIGTSQPVRLEGKAAIDQRKSLVAAIRAKKLKHAEAFDAVIEEVAYTWFNRLIAVRFMEVNDYLPSRVRVLSSENPAKAEPDFVTNPFDTDLDFTEDEINLIDNLKDNNKSDELFQFLFIKQCNKLNEILPELFEETNDYTELLLNVSFTDKDGVVHHLVHDISEDDFNIEKQGQVEIIGWLYQYYNTEPKDKVFGRPSGQKIRKEDVPAATQLFTPDWIVRYMVENSLGRILVDSDEWLVGSERIERQNEIAAQMGWKYFLPEAEQSPEVYEQLKNLTTNHSPLTTTFLDPCMGSGHILVYAFDVFMDIYTAQGYTERDAAQRIVEKNLYGLELDDRATQLAYFAVMMKARSYDRRFLNRGIRPNLCSIQESNGLNEEDLELFGDLEPAARRFVKEYIDAKEYGSILNPNIDKAEFEQVKEKYFEIEQAYYDNVFDTTKRKGLHKLFPALILQTEIMLKKYDVVCTNPPYMGGSGMSAKLSTYVKKNYPESKADLFAVFMEKAYSWAVYDGYTSLITMESWMFLSSFEKMRENINHDKTIINMVHMPYLGKGSTSLGINFGTAAVIMRNNYIYSYSAQYEYTVYYETDENGVPYSFPTINDRWKTAKQTDFSKIPGAPIAYWVSNSFITTFSNKPISDYAYGRQGMTTTNNAKYLRLWYEVVLENIGFNVRNRNESIERGTKWFPYNKGGQYRKWYGNNEYVVFYLNDGQELIDLVKAKYPKISDPEFVIKNRNCYFKEGIEWSDLTTGKFGARNVAGGFIFDACSPTLFMSKEYSKYCILALMNTKVFQQYMYILSPTMHYNICNVLQVPIIQPQDIPFVEETVNRNIQLSQADWDSFETSWDFKTHPFIAYKSWTYFGDVSLDKFPYTIKDSFYSWKNDCEARFNLLKKHEEELNRIFIDIYGLQDELTPEVEDKDVTVRKADLQRDMRSFVSYAVGCMFGRYSLDREGLVFAGGDFDKTYWKFKGQAALDENGYAIEGGYAGMSMASYHYPRFKDSDDWGSATKLRFEPDADNCIPITDTAYFEDDIVGRFCEFVKVVFGEGTLEANLEFIAKALGNKCNTSRDIIRNYFLNDFFKDHCKIYQKRPIYWLFDSGKQNGFKALVYMHRWNADTIGNMRVEYLHRIQRTYEKEIEREQDTIDNTTNNRDRATATKRKEKLLKQLKEAKDYDAKVAHLALSRPDIDLDDGVKVNYEKVQTAQDGKKLQILAKI